MSHGVVRTILRISFTGGWLSCTDIAVSERDLRSPCECLRRSPSFLRALAARTGTTRRDARVFTGRDLRDELRFPDLLRFLLRRDRCRRPSREREVVDRHAVTAICQISPRA